ncbi:MAG TPA: TetR/AcrR family transcriptional regulator [Roseiarcus sp.]|nr:TetR/AcrR family transcriptional regulator [Roseiarcus sp.]
MAKINLERRAEIGREKRARTKAQLIAAAKALFSRGAWEAVTVDEVVNKAGVAKGTFYSHFNDLGELAAAVADDLIQSLDDLIQRQRLTIPDPLLRVAFGCDSFIGKALEDRSWALLVARMARSYPAVGRGARSRLSEDLREALKQSPQAGLSLELGLEVAFGIVLQVTSAIGDDRLDERDRAGAVRSILAAIGISGRDAKSIGSRLAGFRRAAARSALKEDEGPLEAELRDPPVPLERANAARAQ